MNSFYTLHNTLITELENFALVNKVTYGDLSEIDLDRNSVYPLVHIVYGTTTSKGAIEELVITFTILDIVHELSDHTTNLVDVWNNTNEIAKFIIALFWAGALYDLDFKLVGEPSRDILKDTQTNGLSGFQLSMNIQLPFQNTVC